MRTIVQSEAFEASSAYLFGGSIEADEWLREVECELSQELNFAIERYPLAGMSAGLLRRTMITPSNGTRGALVVSFSVEINNTHHHRDIKPEKVRQLPPHEPGSLAHAAQFFACQHSLQLPQKKRPRHLAMTGPARLHGL